MKFFDIDERILEASEKAMALCADKLRALGWEPTRDLAEMYERMIECGRNI